MRVGHRSGESPSRAGQARPSQPAITIRQRDPGPCPRRPGSNACKRYPIAIRHCREESPKKNATRWSPKGPPGPSGDDPAATKQTTTGVLPMTDDNTPDRNNHARASSTTPQRTARPCRTSCSPSAKSPTSCATRSPPCVTGATSAPDRTASASDAPCRYWHHNVTTWLIQQSSASDHPRPRNKEVKPGAGRAVSRDRQRLNVPPAVWSPNIPQNGRGQRGAHNFRGNVP